MDPLYYQYYDKLYSNKDYKAEVDIVLGITRDIMGSNPKRLLDVGCGTGSHALIFAQKGVEVVGIDLDCEVIEIARRKLISQMDNAPTFFCEDVDRLGANDFELAVSLFNVANYVDQTEKLLTFFKAIHQRLTRQGVFIFDCWNGLAAILDPPRNKDTQLVVNDEHIEIVTRPRVELMDQAVTVDNEVKVTNRAGETLKFTFRYRQSLWTPWYLRDILKIAGFRVLNVSAWMQPTVMATYETWKIMFTCQKVEEKQEKAHGQASSR
jgi:SAM-dependent methyltransferase